MIRQTSGTLLARVHVTGMNLLTMMLAGHSLGPAGLGGISLVVLGITLLMLPAAFIGGGALVHQVPRTRLSALLWPAHACAVLGALAGWALLLVVPLVPAGTGPHVAALALLQAMYTVHLGIILGRGRIGWHNLITALQGTVLLLVFALGLRSGPGSLMDYILASYVAFGITLGLSAWAVLRLHRQDGVRGHADLRGLLRQGWWVTGANALQLVNYRFAYTLVEGYRGMASLGIYSIGNQLAESAWLLPRSLGMVLLSQVSNEEQHAERIRLALLALKISLAAAAGMLLLLVLLPGPVYALAFGKDVTGLRPILLLLVPGILAMAASQAFSHYFSGIGRNRSNMLASGCGMLVTLGMGPWAVARWGMHGAAATASLSYMAGTLLQFGVFLRTTQAPLTGFLPNGEDLRRARSLLARSLGRGR